MLSHLCDKTVTVQSNAATLGADMTRADSWATLYENVSVRIVPLSARQLTAYMGAPSRPTHRVYVAATSLAITTAHRLLYGSRILNIQGVRNPHEQGRFLVLECEEFQA